MPAINTEPPLQQQVKYWAFISYSHRDRRWAEWLHGKLETFRIPRRLVGTSTPRGPVPARLFPMFRDREELPVSADLGRNIEAALERSRYLIVICSPAAAKSRWVNEEVLTFKRLGRADRILGLIVDGEPNASDGKSGIAAEQECFPEALRFAMGETGELTPVRSEPLAADVRPGQDGKENAFLKLVAGLIAVNYDDLRQREHERKVHRLEAVAAASLLLVVLFAILGVALYFQRNYARQQRNRAEAALEEVRRTLSQSDYLQAVESVGKGATPEALAFLSRAVRTNSHNAPAVELLISALADRSWLLPMGKPIPLGEEVGIAIFDREAHAVFVSQASDDWEIRDLPSGRVRCSGKVVPSRVGSAAFSPDGRRIAIACGPLDGNVVGVWDAHTGAALTKPFPIKGVALSLAFSADSKGILVAEGNFAGLHDAATGADLRPPVDHHNPVMCAAMTPDQQVVVSGALFESLYWKTDTGEQEGALKHEAIPQSVVISNSGEHAAIALGDGTAAVVDITTRAAVGELMRHRSDVNGLRFNRKGNVILSWSNDRTAVLWDPSTGKRLAEPMLHEQAVIAAAFTPAEDAILTVAGGHGKPAALQRWAFNRPAASKIMLQHEARVLSFAFSPDGTRLITGCADGKVTLWDPRTQQIIAAPIVTDNEPSACAFSPDGSVTAVASGAAVGFLDPATLKPKTPALMHSATVSALLFTPDGTRLATATREGIVQLWNVRDGAPSGPALRHPDAVEALAISPNGKLLVTGCNDHVARLWDPATGQAIGKQMEHNEAVTVAGFDSDGKLIVTGTKDGSARVWDARTGEPRTPPLAHDRAVTSAHFSPDGRALLISTGEFGGQGAARVWEVSTGQPLTDPMLHPDGVLTAVLVPGGMGDRVVTGCFDGATRVWDMHSGKPRSVGVRYGEPVMQLTFAPDGARLAAASGTAVHLLSLIDPTPPAPAWLASLAERMGGLQFSDQGLMEPASLRSVDDLAAQLTGTPDTEAYTEFGRWFLGVSPAPSR